MCSAVVGIRRYSSFVGTSGGTSGSSLRLGDDGADVVGRARAAIFLSTSSASRGTPPDEELNIDHTTHTMRHTHTT